MGIYREHHGLKNTTEYSVWKNMRQRCRDTKSTSYKNYGARGIEVCERWHKFSNFLADMGHRPNGYQLDRIDNDGDYEPSNCRWVTLSEQANNTRQNHLIEYDGVTMTMVQWSRHLDIKYKTLAARINDHHWSIERALRG